METREFPNISFEHPRGSTFRKYRSRTLAPVQFTNPNSNHRAVFRIRYYRIKYSLLWWSTAQLAEQRVHEICGIHNISTKLVEFSVELFFCLCIALVRYSKNYSTDIFRYILHCHLIQKVNRDLTLKSKNLFLKQKSFSKHNYSLLKDFSYHRLASHGSLKRPKYEKKCPSRTPYFSGPILTRKSNFSISYKISFIAICHLSRAYLI